ncbi:MAG: ParA family protein [Candidatus Latescibacterota bacterium]|nr:MAG: ParA family protein [Candidatus Latescibacterota bacterium]
MGKIVAIANQKGGVGKTTTAVNLCASLAAAEKKTRLVDMDPQANAGSGVGVDKRDLGLTVYEVLLDNTMVEDAIIPMFLDRLFLLPSNERLTGAEVELVAQDGREFRLRRALERVKEQYEYIFIDCPPGMGLLTLNALAAADSVIMPVQCEYYALEGLGQLLETVRLVQTRLNPGLEIEGVLLTMFDRRLNLANQVVQDAIAYFGDKVFETIIPRNVKLSESPSYGKPILLYDAQSQGAQTYLRLAREVINSVEESVG